jgi:thioredoxin 1
LQKNCINLLKLKYMPVVVTDQTFKEVVLDSKKPVVVDFWAVWCGPCRMVAPVMDQLEAKYGDKIIVAKVDVDKQQKYAAEYGVRNIPTILVFQNGEAIGRQVGVAPFDVFDKAIGQLVD